jgi:hypothetical protein
LLGPERCERGVQEALTDEKKLEIIKAKFAPSVLVYGANGEFIGRAHERGAGKFEYSCAEHAKVYFWSFETGTTVHPLRQPLNVAPGDTICLHTDMYYAKHGIKYDPCDMDEP